MTIHTPIESPCRIYSKIVPSKGFWAKLSFSTFQKNKIKTFLEIHFFSLCLIDFSKKTWNIVERNTFHPNMLSFLENVFN